VHLQGKAVATTLDVVFAPFGSCALQNNRACTPAPLVWQDFFDKVSLVTPGCHPLLEKSTIKCSVGGTIGIVNTLQISVPLPPLPSQAESVRTSTMSLCPLLLNEPPAAAE